MPTSARKFALHIAASQRTCMSAPWRWSLTALPSKRHLYMSHWMRFWRNTMLVWPRLVKRTATSAASSFALWQHNCFST